MFLVSLVKILILNSFITKYYQFSKNMGLNIIEIQERNEFQLAPLFFFSFKFPIPVIDFK